MPQRYPLVTLLFALVWLSPATAEAKIFRCVAKNGELTFSQAPCPEKDTKVTVVQSTGSTGGDAASCEHARRFALDTAQQMKSGAASNTIFDNYGGLGGLSNGSVGLISYVFQFRTNADVSAERISALATAKCQAKAFGDVSCEQLPASFSNRLGGCDKDDDEEGSKTQDSTEHMGAQASAITDLGRKHNYGNSQNNNAALQARDRKMKAVEEQRRLECRDRIEKQIDGINTTMRSGYSSEQGESLKSRRRDLETRLRDC